MVEGKTKARKMRARKMIVVRKIAVKRIASMRTESQMLPEDTGSNSKHFLFGTDTKFEVHRTVSICFCMMKSGTEVDFEFYCIAKSVDRVCKFEGEV